MNNDLSTTNAIRMRRSVRKYILGADVTDEQLKLLLEAAMMAPSACNSRPWKFVVVQNREMLDMLSSVHPIPGMLKTASCAIVVCALPEVQEGKAEGFFPLDCAAATQNILIQATSLGLGSCWCGVYPKEDRIAQVREILDMANDLNVIPFNIIAIGIPDGIPDARGFYEADKVKYI